MPQQPTVHILLATYNGARYLHEQLESIASQTHSAWTLTVSDDGSTDDTLAIVQRFATQVAQPVLVLQGPRKKSATANFCHLVAQVPEDNFQDLYAFCDQDDVWYAKKLETAVTWHAQHPNHSIRLYCGRTLYVNERLEPIGLSPSIKYPPSFANALVQNIASGNTMVFNHAVLMAQKKIQPAHSVWHDWTTYIVTTALGGLVRFDVEPCLYYRQHAGNVIGSNDEFKTYITDLRPLFKGRFKQWSEMNTEALQEIQCLIMKEHLETLSEFKCMRTDPSLVKRITTFYHSKVRRQLFLSNARLALALALKLS